MAYIALLAEYNMKTNRFTVSVGMALEAAIPQPDSVSH
jgi:hypothetical protein